MVRGAADKKTSDIQARSPVARDMVEHVKCISTKRVAEVGARETEAPKLEKVERYLLHCSKGRRAHGNQKRAEKVGNSDGSSYALQDQKEPVQEDL